MRSRDQGASAAADRAAHEPSQSALSRPSGEHPLRGCAEGVAIMASTICALEGIRWLFGTPVALAVASTALILIVVFLYHVGSQK